jgi:membrane protease YdiL (CAAX protease family)
MVILSRVEWLTRRLSSSPTLARVAPFAVFLGLTWCQGRFGEEGRYWFYLAKTITGALLVWSTWRAVTEMRWVLSWEAVVAGVLVFAFWVGLDGWYPPLDQLVQKYLCPLLKSAGLESWCGPATTPVSWNPHRQFGEGTTLAWFFVLVRIAGSTLVVPPIEEAFYRSFVYRYIEKPDFQSVALGAFLWMPFIVTSGVFGFGHYEWLPGILCGFVYQGLVCWKKRLGDAMTAHAITNFLLGVWIVWKGAWYFW